MTQHRNRVVASLTDLRAAAATRNQTSQRPSSFPIPNASLPETESEDSDSESGFDSDDSGDENARKELFRKLNGTQQTSTKAAPAREKDTHSSNFTSKTESDIDSDSESENQNGTSKKNGRLTTAKHEKPMNRVSHSVSEPSFDVTSEPESDAEDEGEAQTDAGYDASTIPAHLRGTGFQVGPNLDGDSQRITDVLKKAKATGQQIWYFTVPEGIPVTAIETMAIDMQAAREGRTILSHHDSDYTMSTDNKTASPEEMKLIVADKSSYSQGMVFYSPRFQTLV